MWPCALPLSRSSRLHTMFKWPGNALLVLMMGISVSAFTECDADDRCNSHRICAFGSLAAYNSVRQYLFSITSCQKCEFDCSGTCVCDIASSKVQQDIQAGDLFCTSEICTTPLAQHALQYETSGYPCETSFVEAQKQLIRLCGRVNGNCCLGRLMIFY